MSTIQTGDTIYVTDPGLSYDAHLWVVLSDPGLDPGNILMVNFTSWRADKDQACVLDQGDHSYITHKTCVNFRDSKVVTEPKLRQLLDAHLVTKHDPMDLQVLDRIREGAMRSRFMPLAHAQLLIDQGLVASDWEDAP